MKPTLPFRSQTETEALSPNWRAWNAMDWHIQEFGHALSLFDACESSAQPRPKFDLEDLDPWQNWWHDFNRMSAWKKIAIRDGALSLFHFSKAFQAARSFRGCPQYAALVDHKAIRLARDLFNSRFPHAIEVRDAVGHAGEVHTNELFDHAKEHRPNVAGPEGWAGLYEGLHGRTFITTYKKRLVGYELSAASLSCLIDVINRYYSALPGAQRVFEIQ